MEVKKTSFSLGRSERGAAGVEYAILVAAVALALYSGGALLGKNLSSQFSNASKEVTNQVQPQTPPADPGGVKPADPAGGGGDNPPADGSSPDNIGGPGESKDGTKKPKPERHARQPASQGKFSPGSQKCLT